MIVFLDGNKIQKYDEFSRATVKRLHDIRLQDQEYVYGLTYRKGIEIGKT
jgi:hypothetical protein